MCSIRGLSGILEWRGNDCNWWLFGGMYPESNDDGGEELVGDGINVASLADDQDCFRSISRLVSELFDRYRDEVGWEEKGEAFVVSGMPLLAWKVQAKQGGHATKDDQDPIQYKKETKYVQWSRRQPIPNHAR